MPDIPEEAVTAAVRTIWHVVPGAGIDQCREIACTALEAATPAMADHVAAKISAHKYEHEPKGPLIGGKTAEDQRRRT